MMKFQYLIILICFNLYLSFEFDKNLDKEWELWKKKFNKTYARNFDGVNRRQVWENAHRQIVKHNQEASMNKHTFTLSHNEFSDLTFDEFSQRFLAKTTILLRKSTKRSVYKQTNLEKTAIPDEVDWRKNNIVSPIRLQGRCGACWALAAIGSIESQYAKLFKKKIRLSPQQLIDCDIGNNNIGCEGGMPERAFNYYIKNGAQSYDSYPYTSSRTGKSSEKCYYSRKEIIANVTDWEYTSQNSYTDENSLKNAIAIIGPIAVAIQVTPLFQYYKSGIFYDPECNKWLGTGRYRTPVVNHAVLAVGYGKFKNGEEYYIIQNSWSNWGLNGYALMSRNRANNCHIAAFASYPII